jgi:hypothetical protein
VTYQELAVALADKVKSYVRADRAAIETRLAVAEARLAIFDTVTKELGGVKERLAVVEVLKPVPGPAGEKGEPGRDGTLDQIKLAYDGRRTVTFCYKDGTPIDGGTIRLGHPLDEGIWRPGVVYEQGAGVTHEKSWWIAQCETSERPGVSKTWRLAACHGQPGRNAT